MSQPPVDRERRVLYTSFRLPDPDSNAGVGHTTLARIREGAHRTVSQQPGYTG